MPELPVVNAREMMAALRRAGFVERRSTGGHAIFRHPGSGRVVSGPVHGGDLRVGTTAAIVRQSGLSTEEFIALLR